MQNAQCLMPNKKAKRLRHLALGILHCAVVSAACSNPQAAPSPPRPLRIVSAFPGGSPFNRTLAGVYDAELSDTAPEVRAARVSGAGRRTTGWSGAVTAGDSRSSHRRESDDHDAALLAVEGLGAHRERRS